MIYKPTSCEPLLLTFDATQTPFFLECQIDSANTKVDAYSIKLLNSDNNEVVFSHDGKSHSRFVYSIRVKLIYTNEDFFNVLVVIPIIISKFVPTFRASQLIAHYYSSSIF